MCRLVSYAFVLLTPAVAFAEEPATIEREPEPAPSESRPGLLNDTAGVPSALRGWGGLSGESGRRRTTFDLAAMVSPTRRIAIGANGNNHGAASAGAHVQFLEQPSAGIDLTTSVRWRMLATEGTGHQLFGRMVVGRAIGPTYVAVNGGIGQGVGARQDIDYEAGGLFFVRPVRMLRLGAEGRVRGELVETYLTPEDEGRPVEITGGATLGADLFDRVLVQALGGWLWPRGPLPAGPAVLGAATVSF
jgi:hypothetical protein